MISVRNLVEKEDASQILAKAISTGAMPGAVFLTGNSDEIIDERCPAP